MNWFNRKKKNINTPTSQKKELPDGMWYKTPGGSVVHIRELKNNSYVCRRTYFSFQLRRGFEIS